MASPSSAIVILLVSCLICLPPFLAHRLFMRSYRRAQRRGLPSRRYLVAAVVSLLALMNNLGTLLGTSIALGRGEMQIYGLQQGIAIGIAWVCFWVWLFLEVTVGRRMGRRRGLD